MKSFLLAIFLSVIILFSVSPNVEGTVITFDDQNFGLLYDQYAYLGVTFSGPAFIGPDSTEPPGSSEKVAIDVFGSITATFDPNNQNSVVHSVSVDYYTASTLYLVINDNHVVTSTTFNDWDTFGLSLTGETIETVEIHDGGGTFVLDNFTFPAPEASTMTLFASCLIGLTYVRRKI